MTPDNPKGTDVSENERRARELLDGMLGKVRFGQRSLRDAQALDLAAALDEAESRGRPQWRPVGERPRSPS